MHTYSEVRHIKFHRTYFKIIVYRTAVLGPNPIPLSRAFHVAMSTRYTLQATVKRQSWRYPKGKRTRGFPYHRIALELDQCWKAR